MENTVLEKLPFSAAFRSCLKEHGFITLQQLMDISLDELMETNWFSLEMMDELYLYMKERKQALNRD